LLRRHHQRVWRDVFLRHSRCSARSLGHRCVHPGAARIPTRTGRRHAAGTGEAAMSARVARPVWQRPMLIAAGGSLIALAIGLAASPKSVMQGWLIAFVFISGIPIGSLVLLLIHRLTGGRWGTALAPILIPAAAMLPLLALVFLPLAFGLSAPYRWASDTSMLRPSVAHVYLNQPAFLLRTAIALVGWS